MSEPAPLSTSDALDALVHQFADPLAFFRELVQNSIDAGSAEIDVHVEHLDGVLEIRVDDYGAGMDRQIIDTRLTRLFSSSKEGDQTKIGRFGIGFVSVFALEPDAVVVDTARGGESWRVLFRADRSFERIALRVPVDGTKVRILKRADAALYEEVRRRAPEVLARYCRHAAVEIRFHGQAINEAFDLDSPCKVVHREPGSDLVVGYAQGEAFGGYYNRGLMLLEETLPGQLYSFKINSQYLEHTLTRDNLLRDAHHDALMARVRELAERALPALLFERLEQAVEGGAGQDSIDPLLRLAARQIATWGGRDRAGFDAIADRKVALAFEAGALRGVASFVSLRWIVQPGRGARVYLSANRTPVSDALSARGDPVLRCDRTSALPELLRALGCEPCKASAAFCAAQSVEDDEGLAAPRFAAVLLQLLRAGGARVQAVRLARIDDPGSAASSRLAVLQRGPGELTEIAFASSSPFEAAAGLFELAINVEHPSFARLAALAEHEPELAAHLTCKLLLVGAGLTPQRDGQLAQHALEARWQRSTS
jgi:molecular chaperone HtpG